MKRSLWVLVLVLSPVQVAMAGDGQGHAGPRQGPVVHSAESIRGLVTAKTVSDEVLRDVVLLADDDSPEIRLAVSDALRSHSGSSVRLCALLAEDGNASRRRAAVISLGYLGRLAAKAVAPLVVCAGDQEMSVANAAVSALERVRPFDPRELSPVLPLLKHPRSPVRAAAFREFEEANRSGLDVADYETELVRAAAAETSVDAAQAAVRSIGAYLPNPSKDLLAVFSRLLKHEEVVVRSSVVDVLAPMAWDSRITRLLEDATRDTDEYIREAASEAILAGANQSGVLQALKSEVPSLRRSALEHLDRSGRPTAEVLAGLRPLLRDDNDEVRALAAFLLTRAGDNVEGASFVVVSLLRSEHPMARANALRAIKLMNTKVLATADAMTNLALNDPHPLVRWAAVDVFASQKLDRATTVSVLRRAMADTEPRVRISAAAAYAQATSKYDEAIEVIRGGLQSNISDIRLLAAEAIPSLGEGAVLLRDDLRQAVLRADPQERSLLERTLRRIQ